MIFEAGGIILQNVATQEAKVTHHHIFIVEEVGSGYSQQSFRNSFTIGEGLSRPLIVEALGTILQTITTQGVKVLYHHISIVEEVGCGYSQQSFLTSFPIGVFESVYYSLAESVLEQMPQILCLCSGSSIHYTVLARPSE